MNWRIDELKNLTIMSNSDAHSAPKLGREANIMDVQVNYKDIYEAIKTNDKRFVGTIEFYPDEGKYHYDGHAKCNVSFSPEETKKLNGICPVCKKPLTVGVMYRVGELANEKEDYKPKNHKTVEYIVPLQEIIAECLGQKVTSNKVILAYEKLVYETTDEFSLLRHAKSDTLKRSGIPRLDEAIERMRKGNMVIKPGYDGVYGVVKVFEEKEGNKQSTPQLGLGF
jgi:uncharacterized protein (TIGR00375 family)